LGRVVVEDSKVSGNRLVDAGDDLVDLEVVVSTVEPDLVFLDRSAQLGVGFPEEQVRVRALLRATRIWRTRIPAVPDIGRLAVAADEASRLVGEVLETLERVAAALDRRHDGGARRVHLDVGAKRADR